MTGSNRATQNSSTVSDQKRTEYRKGLLLLTDAFSLAINHALFTLIIVWYLLEHIDGGVSISFVFFSVVGVYCLSMFILFTIYMFKPNKMARFRELLEQPHGSKFKTGFTAFFPFTLLLILFIAYLTGLIYGTSLLGDKARNVLLYVGAGWLIAVPLGAQLALLTRTKRQVRLRFPTFPRVSGFLMKFRNYVKRKAMAVKRYANKNKQVWLLLAGAVASIIGGMLVKQPEVSQWLIALLITLFIVFLLLGLGTFSKVSHKRHIEVRRKRHTIGILSDMNWCLDDCEIRTWTDVSPQEWLSAIIECAEKKGVRIPVELIGITDDFPPYAAIVNPYGGVYPEQDLVKFTTLDNIFTYVQEGGLFINVADIPGYWAYDFQTKRKIDVAPSVWQDLQRMLIFDEVPWMKRLRLQTRNVERVFKDKLELYPQHDFENIFDKLEGVELHRLVIPRANVKSIHRCIVFDDQDGTAMFFAKYGDGYFLISLICIEAQSQKTKGSVKTLTAKLILSKLLGELGE